MNHALDLSLVVPTLNEAGNLPVLFRRLSRALSGIRHEILVVDDGSKDGTAEVAKRLSEVYSTVGVIRRTGPRGLSRSILEGFRAAHGAVLGVMDADLQHDPRVLPALLSAMGHSDFAIGSRYAFKGTTCGWSVLREVQSRAAAALTRSVLGLRVKDPLSGFFCVRREVFEAVSPFVQARGWKILLEILALSPAATVSEVPITFKARVRGKTKMNAQVVWAWLSELRRLRKLRWLANEVPADSSALVLGGARP